ncbi:MAG: hypothetical protein GVY06_09860 [Alphaproteobacteria bacterium]|nr:hypothetical protein [Alphaproteobacteria bacterium]
MSITYKRWTGLGLGAALAGSAILTACGQAGTPEGPAPEADTPSSTPAQQSAPRPAPVGEMGEGEGGPGGEGEGGEGGVSVAAARTDPVEYLSALAITRAHAIAARDAYAIGKTDAAGEMFAHPVSEVLLQMEPVFEARGVEPFDNVMSQASAAVFEGESVEQIRQRTETIFETLDAAAQKAPASDLDPGRVAAGVVADQVSRAVDLYRGAMQSDAYEPYLDGYGYYLTAKSLFERQEAAIREAVPEAAGAMEDAFRLLEEAFPTAERPESLAGDASAMAVAEAEILLALSGG